MNSYILIDLIEFCSDDLILKYTYPRNIKFSFNYLDRIKTKFLSVEAMDERYSILVELLKTRGCFMFLKDKQFMKKSFSLTLLDYIDDTYYYVLKVIIKSLLNPNIRIDSHIDTTQVFEIVLELLVKHSKHYYMRTYNTICNLDLLENIIILNQIAKSEVIQYLINKLLDKQVKTYQNCSPNVLFYQAPGPIKGMRKSPYPSELDYMRLEYEETGDLKEFIVTKDMLRHFHCGICNPPEPTQNSKNKFFTN